MVVTGMFQSVYSQRNKTKEGSGLSEKERRAAEFYFAEGVKFFILEDYAQSLVKFLDVLNIDEESDAANFKIAKIYAAKDEIDLSLDFAKKAVELDPNNKFYLELIIDIYTSKGNLDQATIYFEKLLAKHPRNENGYFELAAVYMHQKKYDDAIRVYDLAEQVYGVNQTIVAQKQKVYLRQNNIDMAIAEGKKLIDAYKDEPYFVLQLAELMTNNERNAEAQSLLEDIVSFDPDYGPAHLLLAELQKKQGDTLGAIVNTKSAFESPQLDVGIKIQVLIEYIGQLPNTKDLCLELAQIIVETHPNDFNAHLINGDLRTEITSKHEPENKELKREAAYFYSESVELKPDQYSVWQNLINLDLQLSRPDSVLIHSEKALELFPNQAVLYLFAGIAHFEKKNYDAAVYSFSMGEKMAINNENLQVSFLTYLGDTYNALGDNEQSDSAYDKVLVVDPNNDLVLNNYSYYLSLRKEKLEQAKTMSGRLVRKHPNNPTYLDTYAWVLFMLDDWMEAEKMLKKVVESGEAEGVHLDHYGDILYKLGDVEQAVKYWEKARSLDENLQNIEKKISEKKIIE